MSEKIICINKKTISATWIIKELDIIKNETGKNYASIAYDFLIAGLKQHQEERNYQSKPLDDNTLSSLRNEITKLLDTYERRSKVYRPQNTGSGKQS